MKVKDIRKGDIVTYRSRRTNNVNNARNYHKYFNDNFENVTKSERWDIVKIQRYVKILCFYRLKTIYKRYEQR